MTVSVRRELNQTLLVVEIPGLYKENYQIRMLRANRIEGVLPVRARGIEEQTVYEYDISGKVSMKSRFEKKRISAEEIKEFLKKMSDIISELTDYLLCTGCLLLEPEYIFWEEGQYTFCYVPQREGDIWSSFHELMEYFVQWTDYEDMDSVKYSFLLHKETMKENYSLKKIMEKIEMMEEKENEKNEKTEGEKDLTQYTDSREDIMVSDQTGAEPDWITHQEMGDRTLRKAGTVWTPVKRILKRYRRPKWGDWDGLYIDEEEL